MKLSGSIKVHSVISKTGLFEGHRVYNLGLSLVRLTEKKENLIQIKDDIILSCIGGTSETFNSKFDEMIQEIDNIIESIKESIDDENLLKEAVAEASNRYQYYY